MNFNIIIFCFNGFQPHHLLVILTTCMLTLMSYIDCSFIISSSPWSFSFLCIVVFLCWKIYRSYKRVSKYFQNLKKTVFFPVNIHVTAQFLENIVQLGGVPHVIYSGTIFLPWSLVTTESMIGKIIRASKWKITAFFEPTCSVVHILFPN